MNDDRVVLASTDESAAGGVPMTDESARAVIPEINDSAGTKRSADSLPTHKAKSTAGAADGAVVEVVWMLNCHYNSTPTTTTSTSIDSTTTTTNTTSTRTTLPPLQPPIVFPAGCRQAGEEGCSQGLQIHPGRCRRDRMLAARQQGQEFDLLFG